MRLLLDTHILLWALLDDPKLSKSARELLENEENIICYSILSLWEIELKRLQRPEQMNFNAQTIRDYAHASGYCLLNLREKHIFMLYTLQYSVNAKPHKDPFDRLLICQAKSENMSLLTHDALLKNYNELCVVSI